MTVSTHGSLLRAFSITRSLCQVTRFHVSLERAHLVPLYASPGSEAWGVILRSDRNSANYITVTFPEREQLLRFQQLFTGYKTASHRYDQLIYL